MISTFYGNNYFLDEEAYIESELSQFDLMMESCNIEVLNESAKDVLIKAGKVIADAFVWLGKKIKELWDKLKDKIDILINKLKAGDMKDYIVLDQQKFESMYDEFEDCYRPLKDMVMNNKFDKDKVDKLRENVSTNLAKIKSKLNKEYMYMSGEDYYKRTGINSWDKYRVKMRKINDSNRAMNDNLRDLSQKICSRLYDLDFDNGTDYSKFNSQEEFNDFMSKKESTLKFGVQTELGKMYEIALRLERDIYTEFKKLIHMAYRPIILKQSAADDDKILYGED